MKDELFTIQEAANFFGVSPRTLQRWEEKGYLKPQRTIGNQRRYSKIQLSNLFKSPVLNASPVIPSTNPITPFTPSQPLPAPLSIASPITSILTKTIPDGERTVLSMFITIFAGVFSGFVLLGGVMLILGSQHMGELSGMQASKASSQQQVLGVSDHAPAFILEVGVPTFFGKKTTFLEPVAIKKSLEVDGVAHMNGGIVTSGLDIDAGKGKLTASNVVYGLVAGQNVTISGNPQRPTISAGTTGVSSFQGQTGAINLTGGGGISLNGLEINNSGVLSVQGTKGDVTFTAGGGIGIDGTTISNTDTGSGQNIFKHFTIGATDIAAGSNNDTITFAAGSGVILSPNTIDKSITISATGAGSQWVTTGSDIYYNTGNVGIGTTTPGRTLDVSGTGRITGALTLSSFGSNGGVLYTDGSGVVSQVTAGTNTQVLHGGAVPSFSAVDLAADVTGTLPLNHGGTGVTGTPTNGQLLIGNGSGYSLATLTAGSGVTIFNGAGAITIAASGGGGGSNWIEDANGTIYPDNNSLDLLLGGTATASAKFGLINVSGGTPTATISAGTSGAVSLTAGGVLSTTNKQSLTLGSNSTGNIILSGFGSGVIHSNASGVLSTGQVTNAELQNSSITVTGGTGLGVSGSPVSLGGTVTLSNTGVTSAVAGTGIGVSGATGAVTITNNGVTSLNSGTGALTLANATRSLGTITIDNASTAQKGIAQFNGTNFSDNGSGTINTIQNINSTATPTFGSLSLTANTNELRLGTGNIGTLTLGTLTGPHSYTLPDSTGTVCLVEAGNCAGSGSGVTGSGTTNRLAKFTGSQAVGNASINDLYNNIAVTIDANGNVGVGTATPDAQFSIKGTDGGNAAAVINQQNSGNILAASASGTTKFLINNNGNLQFTGNTNFLNTITSLASANQTITVPNLSGTDTLCFQTLANCTGGGGGVTGSGTSGQIAFFTGSGTISSETTGFAWSTSAKKLGIGNDTPVGKFDLAGAVTGKALAIFNETGDQALFTASASGVTKFTIANSGDLSDAGTGAGLTYSGSGNHTINASGGTLQLGAATLTGAILGNNQNLTGLTNLSASGTITFSGFASNGGPLYTNASGVLAQATAGSTSQVLHGGTNPSFGAVALGSEVSGTLQVTNGGTGIASVTTGDILYGSGPNALAVRSIGTSGQILTVSGGLPVWTDPGGTLNFWQRASGAVSPFNITDDLLLGATSSTSAKFAFRNVAGGVPTASISANTPNSYLYLTGDGTLATTNKQSLTIGSASTGNIVLNGFGTGVIHSNGSGVLSSSSIVNADLASGSFTNITGVGTLTAGTWNATAIGSQFGGTGQNFSASTGVPSISGGTWSVNSQLPLSLGGTNANLTAVNGGIVYSNGSAMAISAAGSSGQCLTSAGAGTPTWQSCALGANTNFWNANAGALYSGNTTMDLLLGATATTSAKFAVTNIAGGTPTASVSATATGTGLSLAGDGTIQSLKNSTLTIGGNTTGNITLSPLGGSGFVKLNGSFMTTATETYSFYTDYESYDRWRMYNSINNSTIRLTTNDTGSTDGLEIYHNTGTYFGFVGYDNQVMRLTGGSGNVPLALGANNTEYVRLTTAGALGLNTTNPLATLDVRGNSGTTPVASVSGTTAKAALIVDNTGVGDLFTASKSGATKFVINNAGNLQINNLTTGVGHLSSTGVLSSSTIVNADLASGSFTNITGVGTLTAGTWNATAIGSQFGGTGQNFSASTGVPSISSGTWSVNAQLSLSLGGTNASLTAVNGGIVYSNGSAMAISAAGSSGQCLTSAGAGTPTWQSCALGANTNFWNTASGALYAGNTTMDLLVGGTSSTSAKFAFENVAGNTPVASISANNGNNATYLTGDGILATTNRQTLTLGSASTGNIVLNGFGTGVVHSNASGVLSSSTIVNADLASGSFINITGVGTLTAGTWNATAIGSQFGGTGQNFLASTGVPSISSGTWSVNAQLPLSLGGTGQNFSAVTQGAVPYFSGTGVMGTLAAGVTGQCINSNGVGANISWGSCGGGTTQWDLVSGSIAPSQAKTVDLLLGGTSTASAKFAFMNVNSGTPTASISANSGNNATTLSGLGVLGTTNRQSLTLGSASTGNIILNGFGTGIIHSNSSGVLSSSAISLTADVTGLLPIANGGTNNSSAYTNGSVIFSDGSKLTQDNANFFWDNTNNRLGIGTTSPFTALDVRGNNQANGGTLSAASISAQTSRATLSVDNSGAGDLLTASKSGATKFVVTNAGNVGIGTNLPTADLDVNGDIRVRNLASCTTIKTDASGNLSCGGTGNASTFTDSTADTLNDTSQTLWDGTQPNVSPVSIGSTILVSVYARVTITNAGDQRKFFAIHRSTTGSNATCSDTTVGNSFSSAWGDTVNQVLISTATFLDSPASTNNVRYTICETGVVSPTTPFEEYGPNASETQLRVSLVELGADLAENYYTTDDSMQAGNVVSLDSSLPAGVKMTAAPYDSTAIGIVSTVPGEVLDDQIGKGWGRAVPIALKGRVPVKITAANGAIQPGDWITTSSIPGVAMKATHAGEMLGKAMTGYSGDGVGEILVFVNLSWADPSMTINADGSISSNLLPEDNDTASSPTKNQPQDLQTLSATVSAMKSQVDAHEDKITSLQNEENSLIDRVAKLASDSAFMQQFSSSPLSSFNASSAADLNLNSLDVSNATVSHDLSVLGKTTVNDLGVTGNVTAGLLSIKGLDENGNASINTASGDLQLQNEGAGGINILNGKLTVDTKGHMQVNGNATFAHDVMIKGKLTSGSVGVVRGTQTDRSDTETDAAGSAGKSVITAHETTRTIYTPYVTGNSLIYITPTSNTQGSVPYLSKQTAEDADKGTKGSFTVTVPQSLPEDVKFNWWIVN